MSDLPGYIDSAVDEDLTDEDLQPLLRGLLAMHDYLRSLGVDEPKQVYGLTFIGTGMIWLIFSRTRCPKSIPVPY